MAKAPLLEMLEQKHRAWQEAMNTAKYKGECLENIIQNLQSSRDAEKIPEMTEEERAWLLVKIACVEDVRVRQCLTEALWL